MKKQSKVSALVLALALLSVSGLAKADFTPGMTKEQVAAEVQLQLGAGKSLDKIAAAAKTAGVPAAELATALIQANQNPVAVTTAVVKENPDQAANITTAAIKAAPTVAQDIAKAAVAAAPAQAGAIVTASINAAPSSSGPRGSEANVLGGVVARRVNSGSTNSAVHLANLIISTYVASGGGNKTAVSPS